MKNKKITIIIPARMSSTRFPGKILHSICGIPMIEHVRRRALMIRGIKNVCVATCDKIIADEVTGFGGSVIMTSSNHQSGTSRVSEAVRKINCDQVLLIQGDEPLIIPNQIEKMLEFANKQKKVEVINATAKLSKKSELSNSSFVKCSISENNNILYCFRKTPSISSFNFQKQYISKLLGVILYNAETLLNLTQKPTPIIEKLESIEQIKIIENNLNFLSFEFPNSLPSVNEYDDLKIIYHKLANNKVQKSLLNAINK